MARPSVIDIDDVSSAVSTLRQDGKPINPYQIKKIIGQGSEAKIAWYLQALDIDSEIQDEDPLTKRIAALVRPLALELNEQKVSQVREIEERHQSTLKDKENEIERLSTELKLSKTQLESTQTDLYEANSKYDVLLTNFRLTEEQYNDIQSELKSEKSRHNETKVRLESKIDALKEAKAQKQKLDEMHRDSVTMLNAQYQDLKNQHDNAVEVIKTEKEKYTALENESDRLHSQYEMLQSKANEIELQNITLKSDNSILSAKINHADENIRELKILIDNVQTVSVSLNNKVESLEHSLSQKELSNQRHEDKIQELTIELKQAYDELNKLKAMNLSITNEKSNLASQFQLLESVIDKLSAKKTKT